MDEEPINEQQQSVANRREDGTFGPNNIGNPKGRPSKGYSFTETARRVIGDHPEKKKRLFEKLLEKAEAGDLKAIEMLWAYMDGRPVQTQNINIPESPEEKVRRTLDLLNKNVLPNGSSNVLQDEGGQPVPSDEGTK